MSYSLSTQSSFDSNEENGNKFNSLNSSFTNINNTNVYYFKKDYNSTHNNNNKKVSFSTVQFIKVQSYKKYNRTPQMNHQTILLEQNEVNCNCQCSLF